MRPRLSTTPPQLPHDQPHNSNSGIAAIEPIMEMTSEESRELAKNR